MNFVLGTKLYKNEFGGRRGWDELGVGLYIYTTKRKIDSATEAVIHYQELSSVLSVIT